MAEQNRTASPPSAGAARGFVRVLLTALIAALLGGPLAYLGVASPEVIAAVVGLLMLVAVMPALEAWGKFLRERGVNALFCLVLCLLLAGCATPLYAFGDAYYWSCTGGTRVDVETGEAVCDGELIEMRGGTLSAVAGNMIGGLVGLARNAALMAVGVPPIPAE